MFNKRIMLLGVLFIIGSCNSVFASMSKELNIVNGMPFDIVCTVRDYYDDCATITNELKVGQVIKKFQKFSTTMANGSSFFAPKGVGLNAEFKAKDGQHNDFYGCFNFEDPAIAQWTGVAGTKNKGCRVDAVTGSINLTTTDVYSVKFSPLKQVMADAKGRSASLAMDCTVTVANHTSSDLKCTYVGQEFDDASFDCIIKVGDVLATNRDTIISMQNSSFMPQRGCGFDLTLVTLDGKKTANMTFKDPACGSSHVDKGDKNDFDYDLSGGSDNVWQLYIKDPSPAKAIKL